MGVFISAFTSGGKLVKKRDLDLAGKNIITVVIYENAS